MARIDLAENEPAKATEHYTAARAISHTLNDGQIEVELIRQGHTRHTPSDRIDPD